MGFEGEKDEEESHGLQEFHSQLAKAIGKSAWIFYNGLDTCLRKRSHFVVSSWPWAESHFGSLSFGEKRLLPFPTGRPHLQVNCSCTQSHQATQSASRSTCARKSVAIFHREASNLWWCIQSGLPWVKGGIFDGKTHGPICKTPWESQVFLGIRRLEAERQSQGSFLVFVNTLKTLLVSAHSYQDSLVFAYSPFFWPGNASAAVTWLRSRSLTSAEIWHSSVFGLYKEHLGFCGIWQLSPPPRLTLTKSLLSKTKTPDRTQLTFLLFWGSLDWKPNFSSWTHV